MLSCSRCPTLSTADITLLGVVVIDVVDNVGVNEDGDGRNDDDDSDGDDVPGSFASGKQTEETEGNVLLGDDADRDNDDCAVVVLNAVDEDGTVEDIVNAVNEEEENEEEENEEEEDEEDEEDVDDEHEDEMEDFSSVEPDKAVKGNPDKEVKFGSLSANRCGWVHPG